MLFFQNIAKAVAASIYNHEAKFLVMAGLTEGTDSPATSPLMKSLYEMSHDVLEKTGHFEDVVEFHKFLDNRAAA